MRKIGLFFKSPLPGQVKTRLSPPLPAAGAALLYEGFLLDTISLCRQVTASELILFDGSPEDLTWSRRPLNLPRFCQGPGDLGQRMTRALDALFDRGAERAVLVGSDAPTLPLEYLEEAFRRLESCDLVLGPTADGGYYLIGLGSRPGSLLEDIAWSTARVLGETEARARSRGLSASRLSPWYDVDTPEDLVRLREELAGESGPGSKAMATREILKSMTTGVDSLNRL